MSRDGWRPHIESALNIDAATMLAGGLLRPNHRRSGSWKWGEGASTAAFTLETQGYSGTLTLTYSVRERYSEERKSVTCVIRLSTTPMGYGGMRWWFHCPYTRRRARKLYKFDGIDQFCHRLAIRPEPTYASQRVSGISRIQEKRWAIRRKLKDETSGLGWGPLKPKWMRWKTFERYDVLDDQLATLEDRCWPSFVCRLASKING
jgi:hypothetical protein